MSLFGGELILVAKQAPLRSEAKIMFMERLSLLILFFALPGSAEAENGAPKWLLGRSVVLQYTEARSFEPVEPGSGRPHDDTVDFEQLFILVVVGEYSLNHKAPLRPHMGVVHTT